MSRIDFITNVIMALSIYNILMYLSEKMFIYFIEKIKNKTNKK